MTGLARTETVLSRLCAATGIACIAISAYHFVLGTARTVPGAEDANAPVDSQERFYAAVFAWYGSAWVRAGRRRPVPAREVTVLSGVFALGGVGRVVSIVQRGRPHWFQLLLAAVEFVVPAVFLGLLRSRSR